MQCPACSFVNHESQFCINCGTALTATCEACGRSNVPSARFCGGCGAALSAARPAAVRPSRRRTSANLIDTRAAREGQRKVATILFTDVVESTRLMQEHDAEDAAARVETLLHLMREAVARYDGTVNKVQGDGIMAIFGAPRPQEDHAVRACSAALAMRSDLQELGEGWPLVRIGIHTGEVVLRTVATHLAPQFDAMGLTVHVAARIEQAARRGDIAVSESTAEAARHEIDFEPLGSHRLKGVAEPVALFSPRRIRSFLASEQFRGGQALSPFAGRDAEMALLDRALAEAAEGRGGCVTIEGDPGLGKSRLIFEFAEACRARGLPVVEARATPLSRVTPHHTILSLIRAVLGIEPDSPAEEAKARVLQRLSRDGVTGSREISLLLDFMGLPRDDGPSPGMASGDAAAQRAVLLELISRLARQACRTHALVVLEDLHWLDASSEPYLERFVEALPAGMVLLLCSFRPGRRAAFFDSAASGAIVLRPLDPPSLEAVVQDRLARHPALLEHGDAIVAKAAGNPYFAEELVRELAGRPEGRADELPNSVRGVIEARLERLQEKERDFLQAAAVIGREFGFELVRDLAGLTASAGRGVARRLVRNEMLYERAAATGGLAFKHPLLQEVAYNTMLRPTRADLHKRCAVAFGALAANDESQSALVGHHWEQAGESAQAAAAYVKAALWAGPRAPAHALDAWKSVRRVLAGQPDSLQHDYMRMLANGQIVNLAWREGLPLDEVTEAHAEATGLARKLKDVRGLVLITLAYGRFLVVAGSADDYLAHTEAAMAVPEAMADPSLSALLSAIHSQALMMAGYVARALDANQRALDTVHAIAPRDLATLGYDVRHWLIALRARLLLACDRPDQVRPLLQQLLGDASEKVEALHQMMAIAVAIELAAAEGHLPEVQDRIAAMERIVSDSPTPYFRVLGLSYRALVSLIAGDGDAAVRLFAEALELARTRRAGLEREAHILLGLAEATRQRDPARARDLLEEARAVARKRNVRLVEGLVVAAQLRLAPDCAALRDQLDALLRTTGAGRSFLLRIGAST